MNKIFTLGYLMRGDAVCLGLKKRGFSADKWNGFGGKVEKDESIEEGLIREIREESGVVVSLEDMEKVAVMEFFSPDSPHIEVHVFFIRTWSGSPHETEEMRPEWFLYRDIPYASMWSNDPHWLPRVPGGEKLHGRVWFTNNEDIIERMEWDNMTDRNR